MTSDARSGHIAELQAQLSAERARCAALQDALDAAKNDNDKLKADVASLKGKAKGKDKEVD